jgi:tetratricopeptide (TPR) repeat protein
MASPTKSPADSRLLNPELIKVSNALQTWSQPFEAKFSDAFTIQSNIAQQVAQALDVKLLSPEVSALEQKLTTNAEAYDYYLRGNEYENRSPSRADREIAIEHFERAIALDPSFAAAYASLARTHASMYWFFYDRTQNRVEKARRAGEKALALGPKLSASHEAMGWFHYHTRLDYDAALKEFAIALDLQPNNPDVSYGMAAVLRRQGNMSESVKYWRKTVAANPRQSEIVRQLGETLNLMREYEEADRQFQTAIRLSPDNAGSYGEMARTLILWKGDVRASAEMVKDGRRYGRAGTAEDHFLNYMDFMIALINEDFNAAERVITMMDPKNGLNNQFVYYPQSLLRAQVEELRGSRSRARTFYQSSLETIQQRLKEHPDDERAHSSVGIAYAGLGRFEDAVREGERGRNLLPVEKEAWRGTYRLVDLAHIYTMTGNHDKAIDILDRLLVLPSDLSGHWIKLDPRWRPLRGSKRFQALVESHL